MRLFHGSQKNYRMNITENIWLIVFILWGLPLAYYRSKFRKTVYRTKDWKINFKPVFVKEIKALFGNIYPGNLNYLRIRNSYRIYLTVYFILFAGYYSSGNSNSNKESMKIEIGSTIPDVVLNDQNGHLFDLKKETDGKNVVLFFYPKDDSPGCTKQACSFRDQFEEFVDANAVVIGISGQSVESHKDFAEKHRLTYTLLSDEGNQFRKQFGVPTNIFGLLPGRVTYVINHENKVLYIFNSQSKVEEHVVKALEILKNIQNQ